MSTTGLRNFFVVLAMGALMGCGRMGCGSTVATLSYETIGTTKEASLVLSAGDAVGFSTHADRYSYDGTNAVMLDAELLKGGLVVERLTCRGFDLEDNSGSGTGSTRHLMCPMTAPAGGADTVRVGTRLENTSPATFEGFEVRVHQ
jgi:hypothetical protein